MTLMLGNHIPQMRIVVVTYLCNLAFFLEDFFIVVFGMSGAKVNDKGWRNYLKTNNKKE